VRRLKDGNDLVTRDGAASTVGFLDEGFKGSLSDTNW
jgi:hypothetical protein